MILLFDIDSLLYSACFNVDSPEEAMFKFDESYQKVINDLGEFYEVEEVIPFGMSKNNFRKFITRLTKLIGQKKSHSTLVFYVNM